MGIAGGRGYRAGGKSFYGSAPGFNISIFSGNIPIMKFMKGGKVKFITLVVGI
jgi:hypothetical protein